MSGITNYAVDKPTVPFSGETTQFEDALMKHDVITKEQALLNKGMDEESVRNLLIKEKRDEMAEKEGANEVDYFFKDKVDTEDRQRDREEEDNRKASLLDDAENDSDDSFADLDGDDEFLADYRKQRLGQLKEMKDLATEARRKLALLPAFGDVREIARPEWQVEVNDSSLGGNWVIVALTSTGNTECRLIEECFIALAAKFVNTKFLKIKSTSAIENWPDANLPAVFCYRDGEMQKQMIGNEQVGGPGTNPKRMEWRLKVLGCLPSSSMTKDVEKERMHIKIVNKLEIGEGEGRKGMIVLDTYDEDDDDEDIR